MSSNALYYALQLLVFSCLSFIGLMSLLLVMPDVHLELTMILNIFITSFKFIFITHFVIRFIYKKLAKKLRKRLAQAVLLISLSIAASLLHALIDLPKFNSTVNTTDIELQIASEEGNRDIQAEKWIGAQVGANFVFFTLWSMCYLVVTGRRKERQVQIKLQEQQLENLMAQLNPHFLFNSMNTIRALIYEDRDKAADTVTQLAELFRYNLSSGNKVSVTLQDELDICQRYLDIEKSRLGERINVEFEITSELTKAKLPSMALFTLVENAVKHGLTPLPSGGTITLKTNKLSDVWTLLVSNPFSPETNTDGTKIGLNNLRQRLELMFGSKASLKTYKKNNTYTAEIKVPYDA